MRKTFAQVSGDNALDPLVHLFDAPLSTQAEPGAGEQTKAESRQQSQRQRFTDNVRDFRCLVHNPADQDDVAIA